MDIVSKKVFDQLQNVDNNKCLLVEFVNEDNKISVGYQNWLKKQLSDDELEKIIESGEPVEYMWPKADIKPAAAMKKVVSKLNRKIDWTMNCAIKIYRYGGKCFNTAKKKS